MHSKRAPDCAAPMCCGKVCRLGIVLPNAASQTQSYCGLQTQAVHELQPEASMGPI